MINLPASILVFLCCVLLMRGVAESAKVNAFMVVIKLVVLVLFIGIAASAFDANHLTPFAPHGFAGISAAAGSIFFTFIGLDAVSTAGEEVENPRRNLPLAIIAALFVVITFYILVAQPQQMFEHQEAGLAVILQHITGSKWPAIVLAAGAVVSVFSITLVVLYGQTRILFAMSRDGLAPKIFQTSLSMNGASRLKGLTTKPSSLGIVQYRLALRLAMAIIGRNLSNPLTGTPMKC